MNPNFRANYVVFQKAKGTFMSIKGLINDVKLTCPAKILFQIISSHSVVEGYCYASNKYLSGKLGLSQSRVKVYLRELESSELVESRTVTMGGMNRRRIYIRFDKVRRRYLRKD